MIATAFNHIYMKYILLLLVLLFAAIQLSAQPKYWILFTDKIQISHQEPALSPLALERRINQHISLDIHDYPLTKAYVTQISKLEIQISQQSRWLNAVSARLTSSHISILSQLPFIHEIRPVATAQLTEANSCNPEKDYDTYLAQLSQIGLDDLHANGFRGEGVRIAVLDNGFSGVDTIQAFQHIWDRNGFIFEDDLVEKGTGIFGTCRGSCKHGTRVLSVLAAFLPQRLIGGAPDADYLLFRTENDISETHQEEDNWLAAAEKADSLGVDIIVSALTYKDFDLGEGDYKDSEIDGKTAIVTLAAEIAASRGILVVNSAGNDGVGGISPPADGPHVLAIGSVSQEAVLSSFSSRGPTYDGRIKPDLVARGDQTRLLYSNGSVNSGSGTSYAAPLIGGLAACLWQADKKQHTAAEMRQILRESGNQYDAPDNDVGYGLPQASIAYQELTGNTLICAPPRSNWQIELGQIYPNPASQQFSVALSGMADGQKLQINMMDLLGREISNRLHTYRSPYDIITFQGSWAPGHYVIRVTDERGGYFFSGKVVVRQ